MNKRFPRFYYSPPFSTVNGRVTIDYEIENGGISSPSFCFDNERFNESDSFCKNEYLKNIPLVSRLSFLENHTCEELYSSAIEELNKIDVPEIAKYYRTLILELSRIAGFFLNIYNISSALKFEVARMWSLADRERIQQLIFKVKGNEYFAPYIVPGGVRCAVLSKNMKFIEEEILLIETKLNDYDKLLFQNEFFRMRTAGVGTVTKKEIADYGITGPVARAANVSFDVRKKLPYEIYGNFKTNPHFYSHSDVYDRLLCRRNEISDSIEMLKFIFANIPYEKHFANLDMYEHGQLTVKAGVALKRAEGVNGEFICMLESDGSSKPSNIKFRSPMYHLAGDFIKNLINNTSIDDIDLVLSSLFLIPMEMHI
ncbi:MAG: hypothetical protein AB7T10_05755 [bacterium]